MLFRSGSADDGAAAAVDDGRRTALQAGRDIGGGLAGDDGGPDRLADGRNNSQYHKGNDADGAQHGAAYALRQGILAKDFF